MAADSQVALSPYSLLLKRSPLGAPAAAATSGEFLSRKPLRIWSCLPMAACEVGKFLRCSAGRNRRLAQGRGSTPCRSIINVDIGNQSPLHAIHEPVVHDVVHAAVTARLARHLPVVLPQRVLILNVEVIKLLPFFVLLAIDEYPWRIIRKDPLRPLDHI